MLHVFIGNKLRQSVTSNIDMNANENITPLHTGVPNTWIPSLGRSSIFQLIAAAVIPDCLDF